MAAAVQFDQGRRTRSRGIAIISSGWMTCAAANIATTSRSTTCSARRPSLNRSRTESLQRLEAKLSRALLRRLSAAPAHGPHRESPGREARGDSTQRISRKMRFCISPSYRSTTKKCSSRVAVLIMVLQLHDLWAISRSRPALLPARDAAPARLFSLFDLAARKLPFQRQRLILRPLTAEDSRRRARSAPPPLA